MTKNDVINNIYTNYLQSHKEDLQQNDDADKEDSRGYRVLFTKKLCEEILDSFSDEVKNCLVNGDKLLIKGFIGFEVSERPEREGRNPKTGDVETFPAVKTVKCKISKAIKDAVNGR